MNDFSSFLKLIAKDIYTVSELTARIKELIEEEIGYDHVWVVGEVSNFRDNFSSGHWFFSLKDEGSQLSAVCFKWVNQYIRFKPENGMEVICYGQVGVYERQGVYRLNVKHIEPKGIGAQALALEQLKEKLFAEGLFSEERKRPLPFLPRKIGIVTSPSGAAIKDILKVIERKFPNLEIVISPTRVQGEEAPLEIVRALRRLYRIEELDLIILARGGGSKEDLWAFNEEIVAREVSRSPVPLVSAIGHEIDITISDLVADLRASTPTMAAEIVVKDKAKLIEELWDLKERMVLALRKKLELYGKELLQLQTSMRRVMESKLDSVALELRGMFGKLEALSPLKVLERGYSIAYKLPFMTVIKDSKEIKSGDKVLIRFHGGRAVCVVEEVEN
ncbi:MAG: exodeoxyribonuclease VII large subunit [Deltaproteobacteria bacterium]|jgi:exodeoxyribonuclease VII large subunit|nr:MAG: exodeoxyribonuclease VII large subunit [Deltaproteobacteria bacterium]